MADNLVFNPNESPPCLDPNITVIAQYANSPNLLNLIEVFSQNIRVCGFFNDFYKNIWDLETANGAGLNIWGIIVGVNRTVKTFTGFFWGYNEETLMLARPYHDETEYNDTLIDDADKRLAIGTFRDFQEIEGEITFNDESFKKLIYAKAHANISNYTASDINMILMLLFGDKDKGHELYVQDNQDMTMTIIFNWLPNTDETAIILNAGILFKPAGVELKVDFQIKK